MVAAFLAPDPAVPHRVPSLPARFRSLLVAGRIHVVLCTVCFAAARCACGGWSDSMRCVCGGRACPLPLCASLDEGSGLWGMTETFWPLTSFCHCPLLPLGRPGIIFSRFALCSVLVNGRETSARVRWVPTCGPCAHVYILFGETWTRYVFFSPDTHPGAAAFFCLVLWERPRFPLTARNSVQRLAQCSPHLAALYALARTGN